VTTDRPAEQEFVTDLFAPVGDPYADTARRQLAGIWRQCRVGLQMTEPIQGVLAIDLPAQWPGAGPFEVIAIRQDLGSDRQAILRRSHDILNLSMVFATPIGDRRTRLGPDVLLMSSDHRDRCRCPTHCPDRGIHYCHQAITFGHQGRCR
jgi:hypothetical protein